jgi:hypothetical protein
MVANRLVENLLRGLKIISATMTPKINIVNIAQKMASGVGRPRLSM